MVRVAPEGELLGGSPPLPTLSVAAAEPPAALTPPQTPPATAGAPTVAGAAAAPLGELSVPTGKPQEASRRARLALPLTPAEAQRLLAAVRPYRSSLGPWFTLLAARMPTTEATGV